ncbi:hypothetical protein [Carnimonas nigrificans]|uniref:hypothetical protein n=1 Tax=Carnimonas nigrificans TaxID=64323 RepID=UPI0004B0CA20|nr:hypothetical protein [Carnimonas nigrificans]
MWRISLSDATPTSFSNVGINAQAGTAGHPGSENFLALWLAHKTWQRIAATFSPSIR